MIMPKYLRRFWQAKLFHLMCAFPVTVIVRGDSPCEVWLSRRINAALCEACRVDTKYMHVGIYACSHFHYLVIVLFPIVRCVVLQILGILLSVYMVDQIKYILKFNVWRSHYNWVAVMQNALTVFIKKTKLSTLANSILGWTDYRIYVMDCIFYKSWSLQPYCGSWTANRTKYVKPLSPMLMYTSYIVLSAKKFPLYVLFRMPRAKLPSLVFVYFFI